jgi:large subunit ribosomal protein L9
VKVIFLTDVKKQAKKDEIKDVKDGYATYLINNHLAVAYSLGSVNVLNKQVKQRQDEEEARILECNKIRKTLENKNIKFKVKTGEMDKVFGSISTKQISEELSKMGYNIDKKKIEVLSDINTLGTHQVKINLHKKVSFNINVILTK